MNGCRVLLIAGFASGGIWVLGCAPQAATPDVAVPPHQAAATGERSYEYNHAIRAGGRNGTLAARMRQEFIVALARIGDNKPVNTPFGEADALTIEVKSGDLELRGRAGPASSKRGMSKLTRERLIALLVDTKCFTVIERDDINEIVRELDFGESRYVSEEAKAPIGNLLGAKYIINGGPDLNARALKGGGISPDDWVTHVGFPEGGREDLPAVYRLRMYDVETGLVRAVGEGYAYDYDEALRNAVVALERAARRLAREAGDDQ